MVETGTVVYIEKKNLKNHFVSFTHFVFILSKLFVVSVDKNQISEVYYYIINLASERINLKKTHLPKSDLCNVCIRLKAHNYVMTHIFPRIIFLFTNLTDECFVQSICKVLRGNVKISFTEWYETLICI